MHSAAIKGGEAVSGNIRVSVNPDKSLRSALVNGKEIDPARIYHLATSDYLAAGNDGLKSLANAEVFHRDNVEMSTRILAFIRRLTSLGLPIAADTTPRFTEAVDIR